MASKIPGVIMMKDLKLPANYDFREANNAWVYTCKVCDDDDYDGCQDNQLNDFDRISP